MEQGVKKLEESTTTHSRCVLWIVHRKISKELAMFCLSLTRFGDYKLRVMGYKGNTKWSLSNELTSWIEHPHRWPIVPKI